uniref:GTP binding elongation factor GUF1 n=1 Tax=Cyprinus carpio carpio TaxID=630221 RepID=A0A9J7YBA3_CYPCA
HVLTTLRENILRSTFSETFNNCIKRKITNCMFVSIIQREIQEQTVANFYLAFEAQLTIIPVMNKRVEKQIEKVFDIPKEESLQNWAQSLVDQFFQEVVKRIPDLEDPFKALFFDSTFDHYRGVVANIALCGGRVSRGDKIISAQLGNSYEVNELGLLRPNVHPTETLSRKKSSRLKFSAIKPRDSSIKLYFFIISNLSVIFLHFYIELFTFNKIQFYNYLMVILSRRAIQKNMFYIIDRRVMMKYIFPLNEIVMDFYDQLKSVSSGYACFDYEDAGYEAADLIKMDFLLSGRPVEELATIVHKDKAYSAGKARCERLKESIPRQMFEIAVQAAIGSKIITRENVTYQKNVLAKCLLKKQAEEKKKLRRIRNTDVLKDAFINVLK